LGGGGGGGGGFWELGGQQKGGDTTKPSGKKKRKIVFPERLFIPNHKLRERRQQHSTQRLGDEFSTEVLAPSEVKNRKEKIDKRGEGKTEKKSPSL